jgi:hypothetical protein
LFDHHPELHTSPEYQVQSQVNLEQFQVFLKALEPNAKFIVTKDNVNSVFMLAREF